jgi:hypothetical protein
MNKIIKTAILGMALMFSTSLAFGQNNTGADNGYAAQQAPVRIDVYAATPPLMDADYAIITYRIYNGYTGTWSDWYSNTEPFTGQGAHFAIFYYWATEGSVTEMEYVLGAHKSNSTRIAVTCGTSLIYKYDTNVINVTTWSKWTCTDLFEVSETDPNPPANTTD